MRVHRPLLLGAVGCFLAGNGAFAQTSAPPSSVSVPEDAVLEEIVVTAEHSEANLQKTAIAITVMDGAALQEQGKSTLEDALRLVPGVNIRLGNNAGTTRIVVRGIQEALNGTDPAVNLMNDGIYQSNPGSSPSFDVARVEVLKGPQGTLYGRNATAGAINVITNDPGDTFGGSATVQFGNLNAISASGAVNLPLTDNLSSRVAFTYNKRDGYLSNGANDLDIAAARVKLRYEPTEYLNILVSGEFDRTRGVGGGDVPAPYNTLHPNDPWQATEPGGAYEADKSQFYALVNWNLGFGTLSFQPTYYHLVRYTDNQLTGPTQGMVFGANTVDQWTQELRLSQPESSRTKWQVGFYHLTYDQLSTPRTPLVNAPIRSAAATGIFPVWTNAQANASPSTLYRRPIGADGTNGTDDAFKSWAAFAQVTYPLTDALRVTGGARYTEDTKRRDNRIFNGFGFESDPNGPFTLTNPGTTLCTTGVVNNQPGCSIRGKFDALTWKVGMEYDVGPDSMLYVDAAKGFRSGGPQNLPMPAGYDLSYKPEYLLAYEAGSKNRFLGDTLQLNADVYFYDYTDKQLVVTGPPIGTSPFPSTPVLNVGKATIYGVELATQWLITSNDQVSASIAYNNTNVDEAPVSPTSLSPGDALPNAPLWSETIGYERSLNFSGGAEITLGGNVRFYDAMYIDTNKTRADAYQPAYHQTDLHLGFTAADGTWGVSAFVNNLENEAVRSAVFPNNRVMLEAPRTYGMTLNAKF